MRVRGFFPTSALLIRERHWSSVRWRSVRRIGSRSKASTRTASRLSARRCRFV